MHNSHIDQVLYETAVRIFFVLFIRNIDQVLSMFKFKFHLCPY